MCLLQATVLVALLQPDPETFNLFDDVMLLSEGELSTLFLVLLKFQLVVLLFVARKVGGWAA